MTFELYADHLWSMKLKWNMGAFSISSESLNEY